MIKAKLLNQDASLNDFIYVGSIDFIPGENVTVALQIFLSEKGIRFVPPADATMTLTFIDSDGADIVKTAAVIDADDRSMWKVVLTQEETETLAGQNIEGKLDLEGDGVTIYFFLIPNAIIRNNLAGDC
jgi:hypothetical protein